jgi:ATP-binding cassette subfamily B protein
MMILEQLREPYLLFTTYVKMISVYRKGFALAVLGIVSQIIFYVLYPLIFKRVIDHVIPEKSYSLLTMSVVEVAILLVFCTIGAHIQLKYMASLGSKAMADLRRRMVEKFGRLHTAFFADVKGVDLLSRFTSDMDRVENSLVRSMPSMIENIVVTVACLITIFFIDWRMALVATILLPIGFVGNFWLGKREDKLNSATRHAKNNMLESVEDFMKSWVLIRAFNDSKQLHGRYRRCDDHYVKNSKEYSYTLNAMPTFSEYGVNASVAVILVVSAVLAIQGTLSVGAFIGCFALLRKVADGSSKTAKEYTAFFNAKRPLKRMLELLAQRERTPGAPDAMPIEGVRQEIAFRDINFGYHEDKLILKGVDFKIHAGQSVAIVGSSGCGKSTILKILMRLNEPQSGSVTLDGKDTNEIGLDSYYSHISSVLQEHHLIRGTIIENIAFGTPGVSREDVIEAAKLAQIHDFITTLPGGYDTIVDDRGSSLSGGQRQRIAIARAFVRKSDILILDEPTSMLDPETEMAVNAAFLQIAQGRTMIMVTHRLAACRDFDKIVVLNKGHVEEEGTHEDLLSRNGFYTALWNKQHGFSISSQGYVKVTPERLRSIPIFSALDQQALEDLAGEFSTETFEPGTTVIQEGAKGDKFYITVRGSLQVSKKGADGVDQPIVVLTDGDHFGEIALLKSVPRTATLKTLSHTCCISLSHERFSRLVEAQPSLLKALEESMAARQ